jgi:hypothetical protein
MNYESERATEGLLGNWALLRPAIAVAIAQPSPQAESDPEPLAEDPTLQTQRSASGSEQGKAMLVQRRRS